MTLEQISKVEESYRNSDDVVFTIGTRIFVASKYLKHKKESTIEFVDAFEVTEEEFTSTGDYYGDLSGYHFKYIILEDPCSNNDNTIATVYHQDEVVETL